MSQQSSQDDKVVKVVEGGKKEAAALAQPGAAIATGDPVPRPAPILAGAAVSSASAGYRVSDAMDDASTFSVTSGIRGNNNSNV